MRRVSPGPSSDLPVPFSMRKKNRVLLRFLLLVLLVFGASVVSLAEPVGSTSAVQQGVLTFYQGGTLGGLSALTQGTANLDFKMAPGGTCSAGSSNLANGTCTFNYTFTPGRPGTRYGAVVGTDGSGNVIATAYLQGVGTGPQVNFLPGIQSQIPFASMVSPYAMAVDAAGNLYIAKAVSAGSPLNGVVKETLTGGQYVESTVATGLAYPVGVAVDGAGNVYIADQDAYQVTKMTPAPGGGYVQTQSFSGFGNPESVAVDGSGNVYVGGTLLGLVKETLSGGTYTESILSTTVHAFGMTVDGDGNVYATQQESALYKFTLSGGTYTQSKIGTVGGIGMTVDANGDIFTQGPFSGSLYKVSPSAGGYTQSLVASFPAQLSGIAGDGSGNLFLSSAEGNAVWKLDLADAPSLTFATTAVGLASSDSPQTVTMFNAGNANLSFAVPASGANPAISAGFTLGGASTCPQVVSGSTIGVLAPNATCTDVVSFTPVFAGRDAGTLVPTDDHLNVAGSTQVVPLNGYGTGTALPPTVTSVSPASGPTTGGTVVAITGTNLYGTNVVSFGGSASSSFIVNSATSITASAPPGTGTVDVTVLTPGGTSAASAADRYSYVAPLTQTIQFAAPATPAYAGTSTLLQATGGASGSPVVFSVVSGPAMVSGPNGATLTYTGVGTVTIQATQAGGGIYLAAVPVQRTVSTATLTEPVASTTAAVATVVTFTQTGTLGAITAMTQGRANLDFALAAGGDCAVGRTYLAGQTCTVDFSMTPTHPGMRYGAISLTTSAGDVLANSYVYGVGTGPQVIWTPGVQSSLGSGFVFASGTAVDGSGNVYVSDRGGNTVVEIPAGGGPSRLLATLPAPDDVVVDGSGNVFVISNRTTLSEILAVNGVIPASPSIVTISTGFLALNGMKVDGNGNVFVAGSYTSGASSAIQEVVAVNGVIPANPQIKTLISGVGGPTGLVVDASGNLYVSDELLNRVYKVVAVNGSIPASPTVVTLVNLELPTNVAADGAGNLFAAAVGSTKVLEILAVNGTVPASPATLVLGQGMSFPEGLAVDGSGNVFVADGGLSSVVKLDFADPPSVNFAPTYVGSTSSDSPQTVTMSNDGNADLVIQPLSSGPNPSISAGFTLGSSSTCTPQGSASAVVTLASNGSCTDVVSFSPMVAGVNSGFVVTTDNSLNVAGAMQSVPLNGTGLALVATTATLTVAPNPVPYSKPVTFTAVVTSAAVPTGSVVLSIDGVALPAVGLVNGSASFVTASLAVGTHMIACSYSGPTPYAPSVCNTVLLTVTPQDFSLTAAPPSISIQVEHHATMQLALTSIGSWTGPVTLKCGAPLPDWLTCELPTAPVSLAPNATVQVAFTMDTDSVLGYKASAEHSRPSRFVSGVLAFLVPLGLLGVRRRRSIRSLVLLLAAVSLLGVMNGCSGRYPYHTAAGVYTIPVVATGTNVGNTTPTTHTLNITLTVTP